MERLSTMKLSKVMLILNIWSVETPRYLAYLQRVWQSHPRHVNLKKISNQEVPKHPEVLGRAIRCAPPQRGLHSQRKIVGVQSWLAGLQEHKDLGRSHIPGAQLG
jgi:hypothetical protein